MREIKFRVWVDGFDAPFHAPQNDWSLSLHDTGHKLLMWCSDGIVDELSALKIEQFTGLQDKNGVDIYEGDIVQYLDEYNDEPSIHFVQYLGDKGYPAFELSPGLGFECNGFAGIYQGDSGHIIVIGNIHQNPELLESKK